MNPYTQSVIDASMLDLKSAKDLALQQINQQASGARAFGGSRQGVAEALQRSQAAQGAGFGQEAEVAAVELRAMGEVLDVAEAMLRELENNCRENGITFFDSASGHQGIVHVVGPELGLTTPGSTIACGDSHLREARSRARS